MKVKLLPISYSEIKPLISLAFAGDEELMNKWHIAPGTLEEIVEHTYNTIGLWDADFCLEYYMVVIDSGDEVETIGFTVLLNDEVRVLYSFGISIANRCRTTLLGWLSAVKESFNAEYGVSLWEKNERTISFFERNGFLNKKEFVSGSSDKMILLWP